MKFVNQSRKTQGCLSGPIERLQLRDMPRNPVAFFIERNYSRYRILHLKEIAVDGVYFQGKTFKELAPIELPVL